MKELPVTFFSSDTVQVAKDLLGKIISVNGCKVRIVETEAYGRDAASHAYSKTARSAIMYDTFGHVYVYIIYGMYNCINFTTNEKDAGAVLIRAAEPLRGIEKMKGKRKSLDVRNLCSGPGKLCSALSIDRSYNGFKIGDKVKVFDDGFKVTKILSSSRIGIKEAVDLPWRFFIEGNEFVSR